MTYSGAIVVRQKCNKKNPPMMNDRFDDVSRIGEERSRGSHEIFFKETRRAIQHNNIIVIICMRSNVSYMQSSRFPRIWRVRHACLGGFTYPMMTLKRRNCQTSPSRRSRRCSKKTN